MNPQSPVQQTSEQLPQQPVQPVENQPQISTPVSESKLPRMLIIIFILLIILGSGAYYYLGLQAKNTNQQKQASIVPTITQNSPTPTIDETANPDQIGANWKTYTSSDNKFSFKYPQNTYSAEWEKDDPRFYASQQEGQDAVNCVAKKLGTFQKPCSSGLFDVTVKTQNLSLSNPASQTDKISFTDTQNRIWEIELPIYGLGGTQSIGAIKINNKDYEVEIHIYDAFISPEKNKEQLLFVQQILSTFQFAP